MSGKILIVDDELSIRELLKFNFEKAGYSVLESEDGEDALRMVKAHKPDLMVLDLMLPGVDGVEVCRVLKSRRETSGIPIIMLTARNDEIDKIVGLEMGADDYLTKPFSPRELVARVKAILRRSQTASAQDSQLVVGKLKLDFNSYEVYLDGKRLELTPKEYELLKLFATNIGKAFSREVLLEKIWGYEYFGDTRTVDVHVRHIRAKLAAEPATADAIETVRGVGYRMREV